MRISRLTVALGLALLTESLPAQVQITEFVASNSAGLRDQDGDASDWIELYNSGISTVDLGGWHLTDDAANLTKWTFPSTNLPSGGFLVVFASGKDRAVAGHELHTDFSLAASGEYLALVQPDGVVAQDFAPIFPPQVQDVSYGFAFNFTTNLFVAAGATAKWKVPLSTADFPANWIATNFDDSAWSSGPTALGFGQNQTNLFGSGPATNVALGNSFNGLIRTDIGAAMSNVNATVLIRLPFDISSSAIPPNFLTLQMKYNAGFVAYLNGVEVARRNAPNSLAWNSAATSGQSDAAAAQFENIELSSRIGLLQTGQNVLAIQGLNLSATNNEFLILPQLVGTMLDLVPGQYFLNPTPGAANSGGALGVVEGPQVSRPSGFCNAPFSLSVTSATAAAQIRFTTDDSAPSAVSGALYTSPLTITNTTVLRVIATEPGYLPSSVGTYTYVFLTNILTQSIQSATNAGWPAVWTGTTPDYDMDTRITGPYSAQMVPSLQSLPSVFITTTISNLFDPKTGIYANPTQHGVAWERAAAVEMLDTNGQSIFALDCGLRIQGGAFRSFYYGQKKSFRVLFKSEYGVGRLHFDLFNEPNATQDFNTLVFRAGGNDGYSWSDAGTTVQFTRDEFGRQLFLDMGHASPHGKFVHLYLNGLYWGLYNVVERPNQDFSASYFGGDADTDWDAISGSAMSTGALKAGDWTAWTTFSNMVGQVTTYANYQKLQGLNADGTRNSAWPVYFDKVDYMDYMLVNIWCGNWDWPGNNFWLAYNHTTKAQGFQFYMWDFENTIGNNLARSPVTYAAPKDSTWVAYPYSKMKSYREFQMDFADRVQKYMFKGGLLTPQVLSNRFVQLDSSVQQAIVAETARWGDDNRSTPYTLSDWQAERDWILTNYIPQRPAIVLAQLRTAGVYPLLSAPMFSQFGGAVPAGYNLTLTQTNASGVIYFTLDGSDPRVAGTGAVSATAQAYATPIVINAPTLVRARVLNAGQWSALVETIFDPPRDLSFLELTEIMYDPPNFGSTNGDQLEFLEMKNTGTNTLDLSGLTFASGLHFTFTNGTLLGPGRFFVIGRDASAFHAKYPGVPLNGIYTGKLNNGGDTITLSQTNGATVFSVAYDTKAPWPVAPRGNGYSLVQTCPGLSQAPDKGAKWRASAQLGGSPGADDPAPFIPGIVVNELLANSPAPLVDTIELYNPTADAADISGWFISDDSTVPRKYCIPNGTILPGGGFITFDESQFNSTPGLGNSFAFNSTGESAYLFSADTNGNLTGYSHGFSFDASFPGVSFGRYVDSAGGEDFPAQMSRSFGAPNSGPLVGPIVINEFQYDPPPGGDEFVELLNITSTNIPLFDPSRPTNTWRLAGVGYTFPTNITLGPAQLLLVVQTNPAIFQAKYSMPGNVQVLGPYAGALDNAGEHLLLQAPDSTASPTNPAPYVTVDEVDYNNKAPWPPAADGSGPSLQRLSALAYGNDPINWMADIPTPGLFNPYVDSDGDGLPDWWEVANGTNPFVPDADADLDGDGFTNLQEYQAGTNPHDPGSALKFHRVSVIPDGIALEFQAMSNHSYSVIYTPSLNVSGWTKLADVPAMPADWMAVVTNSAPGFRAGFFRLVTPAQP